MYFNFFSVWPPRSAITVFSLRSRGIEKRHFSRVEWRGIKSFPWFNFTFDPLCVENREDARGSDRLSRGNTDIFRSNDRTDPVFLEAVCTRYAFVRPRCHRISRRDLSATICLSHIRRGTRKCGKSGFTVNGARKKRPNECAGCTRVESLYGRLPGYILLYLLRRNRPKAGTTMRERIVRAKRSVQLSLPSLPLVVLIGSHRSARRHVYPFSYPFASFSFFLAVHTHSYTDFVGEYIIECL